MFLLLLGDSSGPSVAHVKRLLHEYQKQEAEMAGEGMQEMTAGGASSESRCSGVSTSGPMDEDDGEGSDGGDEAESEDASASLTSWGNEEYEEDNVRGLQTSYLKFAARLRRQPLQCVRSGGDGDFVFFYTWGCACISLPAARLPFQPPGCPT